MANVRDRPVFLLAFAIHFGLSVLTFVLSFGSTMARFDTGAEPSGSDRFVSGLSAVFAFLVVRLLSGIDSAFLPGVLGWLPFIANSVLWAIVVVLLRRAAHGSLLSRQSKHAG